MSFSLTEINHNSATEQEKFYDEFIQTLGFTTILKNEDTENVLKYNCTIELGIAFQRFLVFVFMNKNEIELNDISFIRNQMDDFTNKGLIITTAKISRSAKKDSHKKNKIPIDFITKDEIIKRINFKTKYTIRKGTAC